MKRLLIAAAGMSLFSGVAYAKDKDPVFEESEAVKDAPSVNLMTDKAYVLVRSLGVSQLMLMRMPTAEDQAAYEKMRADALAKAKSKYAGELKEYERSKADYEQHKSLPNAFPPGPAPVEPTEANFEFTPFGLLTGVGIGPLFRFSKGKDGESTYLEEVTPGRYRIYGPMSFGAPPVTGTCFCMGSVAFDAKAGEITDLGMITLNVAKVTTLTSRPVDLAGEDYLLPATADMSIDPRLSGKPITRAVYRPVGKLPNYFGVAVARMSAIPGVMRYDQDRIVDLTH